MSSGMRSSLGCLVDEIMRYYSVHSSWADYHHLRLLAKYFMAMLFKRITNANLDWLWVGSFGVCPDISSDEAELFYISSQEVFNTTIVSREEQITTFAYVCAALKTKFPSFVPGMMPGVFYGRADGFLTIVEQATFNSMYKYRLNIIKHGPPRVVKTNVRDYVVYGKSDVRI